MASEAFKKTFNVAILIDTYVDVRNNTEVPCTLQPIFPSTISPTFYFYILPI